LRDSPQDAIINVEEIDIRPNDMSLLCRTRWLNDALMDSIQKIICTIFFFPFPFSKK